MPIWLPEILRVRPRYFANLFHSNIKKGKGNSYRRLTFQALWLLEITSLRQGSVFGCTCQHIGDDIEGIISSNILRLTSLEGSSDPLPRSELPENSRYEKDMWNCGLHPLIHTLPKFNLAQDVGVSQRFSGLGNEVSQTGHAFSVGLIIKSALHWGHLTGWSMTRLISAGLRLVIRFLRFRKAFFWWSETGK